MSPTPEKRDLSDPIIGGDTPFIPFSEKPRVDAILRESGAPVHDPMRILVNGKDQTREMQLFLCAMQRQMILNGETPLHPYEGTLDNFMRSFVASANTELRGAGVGPLISLKEVEQLSEHPAIVEACRAKNP